MQIKANFSAGTCQVIRNGVRIVNYTGQIGYGTSHYWKMGIYRARTSNDTQVCLYRNFAMLP